MNSLNDAKRMPEKDYLWLNLKELPYFRSLVRAVEASFYEKIILPPPTLDIGCGDGHFASVAFARQIEAGIDPHFASLRQARSRQKYQLLLQCDGGKLPFPNQFFNSAFSNSVLEHIPHVEEVLREVHRVLKPNAPFVFCVPNDTFLQQLSIARTLERIGMKALARLYRRFFERVTRHLHSDPPDRWRNRLSASGFVLEKWWHYYPPEALKITEWGHYFGLPSLIAFWLSGKWILSSRHWNLSLTERFVRRHYHPGEAHDQGVYTFYTARRVESNSL